MTPRGVLEPARLAGAALLRCQTDERLVGLARAGSERAFAAIVDRYRPALLRYARRLVSAARAEDLVQEALADAYRSLRASDRTVELRPWLYRIVHNRCVSALRESAPVSVELLDVLPAPDGPDRVFERREELRRVVAAIERLPEAQRAAILLRELDDRSHAEIAAQLGVTGGAARQLVHRARTAIRAAATAATLPAVLSWSLGERAAHAAALSAGAPAAGVGAAVAAKVCATAVVAGAVAVGGPAVLDRGADRRAEATASGAPPGLEARRSEPTLAEVADARDARRAERRVAAGEPDRRTRRAGLAPGDTAAAGDTSDTSPRRSGRRGGSGAAEGERAEQDDREPERDRDAEPDDDRDAEADEPEDDSDSAEEPDEPQALERDEPEDRDGDLAARD